MELRKEGSVAELATLITLGLVLVRPLIGEAEAQEVAAAIYGLALLSSHRIAEWAAWLPVAKQPWIR